jgi:guanine deaminase
MCMSAILWCGIGRVVFAASIDELATKLGQIMLTSRRVADAAPFAAIAILAAEALALFPKRAGDKQSGKMSRRL